MNDFRKTKYRNHKAKRLSTTRSSRSKDITTRKSMWKHSRLNFCKHGKSAIFQT